MTSFNLSGFYYFLSIIFLFQCSPKTEKNTLAGKKNLNSGSYPDLEVADKLTSISGFMLENSDIITLHSYEVPEVQPRQIEFLKKYNRPILCTEYLARSRNNTFENLLPLFKKHKIGAYNWGFVPGKTNTTYHWDSWDSVYVGEPGLWHHDIYRSDLTPYRSFEVDLIKDCAKSKFC